MSQNNRYKVRLMTDGSANQGPVSFHEPVTAKHATVDEAPSFTRLRIVAIRERLRLSQPVFAAALNVSPETIKAWEQGKRAPEGAALRLLEFAEKRPDWILESVRVTPEGQVAELRRRSEKVP